MRFEKMKKTFILLIILLPLGAKVFAQDSLPTVPHYSFRLDSTTIMLGDQTVLAVEKGPVYPSLDDLRLTAPCTPLSPALKRASTGCISVPTRCC